MNSIDGAQLSELLDAYEEKLQSEEWDRQYLLEDLISVLRQAIKDDA